MSYAQTAIETHGIPEDYPNLWAQTLRIDNAANKMGFTITPAEAELEQMMHELWLARANG